ncbi:hypothetical protein HPB48_009747 [Haemaphysalis longicornis]|uniref:Phospholipase B-like n=1 Tax=Haemaphysalis longicornis TaxID=44386 RepID=A0A9J6GQF9_HAELO|nr:hypothetical protein HPB48_009747 [Haemaphysalis longicornis]
MMACYFTEPRTYGTLFIAQLTNYTLFKSLEFIGISGPTWGTQPVFEWSTSGFNDSHIGHPDKWQFGPVHHQWGSCSA